MYRPAAGPLHWAPDEQTPPLAAQVSVAAVVATGAVATDAGALEASLEAALDGAPDPAALGADAVLGGVGGVQAAKPTESATRTRGRRRMGGQPTREGDRRAIESSDRRALTERP
jgi:hypothetical protein